MCVCLCARVRVRVYMNVYVYVYVYAWVCDTHCAGQREVSHELAMNGGGLCG